LGEDPSICLSTASQTHNQSGRVPSLSQRVSHPFYHPLKFRVHAPVHGPFSKHHPFQKMTVSCLSPGASATGSTQKRRGNAQNQPNIKSDEDNFNQPYSNTNMSTFNSDCRTSRQLAAPFPASPRMDWRKENDKEESHKRLLPISCISHAFLPQQQPRVGSCDTSKARAGEFGVEVVDGKWRMSETCLNILPVLS
jgi:hypothetical protein